MDVQEYFNQQRKLYNSFINFIDMEDQIDENLFQLKTLIKIQKIKENKTELKRLIQLISIVSENHHRSPSFFIKIEKLLQYFKDEITQIYSSSEIFFLFINCRQTFLIILKNNIIPFDQAIFDLIIEKKDIQLYQFFYPEIKNFLDEETFNALFSKYQNLNPNEYENYEEKREKGENDLYICQLIRNDSIESFISFTQKNNISLESTISYSIFETNSFLINKEPTLIEYAAFFGSLQIFQYLLLNDVDITESLLLYAIHGSNAEIIHIIEQTNKNNDVQNEIYESIKCHHNDIANYFINNYMNKVFEDEIIKKNYLVNMFTIAFHYKNVYFYPKDYDNKIMYCYLCRYNYVDIVKQNIGNS